MAINDEVLLDLNGFFPYQFSILAQQMSEFIAQIYKKYDLSKIQWRILATVGQHSEISARDICLFTRLDKMQVSRAISKLMASGVLSQHTSDTDRRTNRLNLTTKGKALYQEIIPLVQAQELRLLEGLTTSERLQLKSLTLKLSGLLEPTSK
ncbi:MAG: winged helix-turn-helix transcriptional regulator [Gammaproteobacteria bacterium]|nr:winged helix-turn-helix transcriptional regulator [Gammaproteobacteria bacterium]